MTIRTKRFLYHLTSTENISSILLHGLQPRSALESKGFNDVADEQIIEGRRRQNLETFVPFHWFARNPFDGRVYRDRPKENFVLIAVSRDHARQHKWRVIPRHPLANTDFELLDYDEGIEAIDWETMDRREYLDQACKLVCMAECLSPAPVLAEQFATIFAPSVEIERSVKELIRHRSGLERLWIQANPNMFPNR